MKNFRPNILLLSILCGVYSCTQGYSDLRDVSEKDMKILKDKVVKIFASNRNFNIWKTDNCYYKKNKDKYYVVCGRKSENQDFFWGEQNILMIFDKEFNLIEMS